MVGDKQFLNTPQAAQRLGLSSATLEHWRMARKGPPFIRMGFRKIFYRTADLEKWIESRVDVNERPRG
jgi:predicted DNA-binding transcriptional regulator AlpA